MSWEQDRYSINSPTMYIETTYGDVVKTIVPFKRYAKDVKGNVYGLYEVISNNAVSIITKSLEYSDL